MYENSHNYHHVNIWGVEPRIRCDHLGDHLGQKIMLIVTVVSVFVSTFISSCIQLKKINSFFFLWSVPWIFSFFFIFLSQCYCLHLASVSFPWPLEWLPHLVSLHSCSSSISPGQFLPKSRSDHVRILLHS